MHSRSLSLHNSITDAMTSKNRKLLQEVYHNLIMQGPYGRYDDDQTTDAVSWSLS
jgi:hypothetical protein